MIMQKDARYLVNKFTHNTSLFENSIYMEGFALDHFNNLKPSTITMAQCHSHLSDKSYQDASTTTTYLCILLQFLLAKKMISTFLTIMWDHTDDCANQYCCASAIYLLSCLTLEFSIIIYKAARAPTNGKYVVYGLNARFKRMLKLEMSNY